MAGPRFRLAAAVVTLAALLAGSRCAENAVPSAVEGCSGGSGKTCAVDPRAAVTPSPSPPTATRTTPKAVPKTARTGKNDGAGRAAVAVRYDVRGDDAGDRGAALDGIVTADGAFRREAGTPKGGPGNAGVATKRAGDDVRDVTTTPAPISRAPQGKAETASRVVANSATAAITVAPVVITTSTTTTVNTTAATVKTTTATANTTTANTTTANTTTVTTITTAATAATAVVATRANVVGNGAQVLRYVSNGYCYCDLTYGSCDINCCCDNDCNNHDLKSFTSCLDHTESSSSIKPESILFDSSLFYVVVENVPSDYFYPERDAIESESQVASSLRNRDIFTWLHGEKSNRLLPGSPSQQPHPTDSAFNSYDLTHKSLRWMYIEFSGDKNSSDIKTFGLKNRAFDSLCTVEQPVEYLSAKETDCQTFVRNMTDVCNNGSSLSYDNYFGYKGIFKVLQPIYSNSQKTEKFGLVAIRATAHHRCAAADGSPYDCRVPPQKRDAADAPQHFHPVYSGGACRRVVDAVEYRLRHNGTGGVRAVDVHFHHRDVLDAGRPVYVGHRFSVRFDRVQSAAAAAAPEPYERSGKPGYATGRPVLVAAAAAGRPYRPVPMVLPDADGRGTCVRGEPRRRTVNFLEAADVRCRVRVRLRDSARPGQWSKRADESADICTRIQNETVAALGDYDGTLVASQGDPDVSRWTPVVVVKPPAQPSPPPTADSCPALVDGVHIRVLYAYVGTFDRPRATVLGVLVNYTASGAVPVVRTGTARDRRADDDGGNGTGVNGTDTAPVQAVADIPVRATVVFVDLTRPPVRTFAEPPTYEFRLPEDFYYPFWSSSDSGSRPPDPPTRRPSSMASHARPGPEFFFLSLAAIAATGRH